MRFAFAHKLSTYLMVTSAYLALVLSGTIGAGTVLLSLIGLIGSWFWEPPRIRFERFTLAWTVFSVVVLVYILFDVFTGGDVLLSGAAFLLLLLTVKLFNRRACKDYLHIYILSFLMLVAGTVLNVEFTYGVFFLGYVVSATWALILWHLRREMEDNFLLKHSTDQSSERVEVKRILNSRRIVGRRFFVGTSLVSITIFLGATLMFLMIPRIGFGLFFQKNRRGLTMAGFSDGVRLGGHGTIKTDDTVVMRVEVSPEFEGRNAPYIHWRGVAFDYYKNGEWRRSRAAPQTRRQITYPGPRRERHHMLYAAAAPDNATLDRRADRGMRQVIYLEPIGYDVLFGASMPQAFEFESRIGLRSPRRERNDEIRFAHTAGIRYEVFSDPNRPSPKRLRRAPRGPPETYEAYLQVPDEITDRVKQLAVDITRGAATDYDKAVAVEQWLKTELGYTLEMRSPQGREPIDFFLFERRLGHCEYFSSAMAIMLRAVGVPTRNVNGFLGGEWNEYNDYIAVRAGDAHSWVEVYFHGEGWVTFDPTPSAEIDRLGRGSGGVRARLGRLMDTLRFKWFKWVIEYDLYRQLSLFKRLTASLRGGASSVKAMFASARVWVTARAKPIGLGAAVIAAVIALLLWRLRRKHPRDPIHARTRRRRRDPLIQLYLGVLSRLGRRGHRRAPDVTPREYARALTHTGVAGADELTRLTELYYRVAYGGHATDALIEEARSLAEAIDRAQRQTPRRKPRAAARKRDAEPSEETSQ